MTKYLLDTNIIIEHLRLNNKVSQFIEDNISQVEISYLTLYEIYSGARNKEELARLVKSMESIKVSFGSSEINRLAIEQVTKHYLNDGLKFFDSAIAATAIIQNQILVTMDKKHMGKIEGLKLKIM